MRTKFTAFVLLLIVGLMTTAHAATNRTVKVKINNQKTVSGTKLTIKFASLVEDSRCPTGTQCIQAGEARVRIQVKNGKGAWRTLEVSTNARKPAAEVAGYTISLADLTPHPANNIRIDRNGYTATFGVVKK